MITSTVMENRFNVAIFISRYAFAATPCGVSTARLLARAGFDVDVFCHAPFDDPAALRPDETNIRIHLLPDPGETAEKIIPDQAVEETVRIVEQRNYAAFIGLEARGLIFAGILAERFPTPLIYYSAELYYTGHPHVDPKELARIKPLEKKYHARCVATIVQDEERGRILMADTGVRTEEIFHVPVGVFDDNLRERGRFFHDLFHLPRTERVLLQFGSIHPYRKSDAIAEISPDLAQGWTLVMHGFVDRKIYETVRAMEDPSRIRLSRNRVAVDDLPRVVASADVGLVFYTDDNLNDYNTGLASDKMARHMQSGTPVITCDFPSFRQVIDRYGCGVCVKDPEEIPGALSVIASDYQAYARGARKAFEDLYDCEKTFRPVLDFLYRISSVPPEEKHAVIAGHARRYAPKVFVETGTFMGDTLEAVRNRFSRLYSIELSYPLFKKAQARFADEPKIVLACGDSASTLPKLLDQIDEPCLFWLDGHYSGGATAKGGKSTPIHEELASIFAHPRAGHVILIDDARDFNGTDDYPTLAELQQYVEKAPGRWRVEVKSGIIAILPDLAPAVECILFSKDRALQLHALLTSYREKVDRPAPIHLLYHGSHERHRQAYQTVIDEFDDLFASVTRQEEAGGDFQEKLLGILDRMTADRLFFLVDDILFKEDTDLDDFARFDPARFVPSLRLGGHLTRCYTLDQDQPLPPFLSGPQTEPDKLFWKWADGRLDWQYPLSVDGHFFAAEEMRQMARNLEFSSPNTFETALQRFLPRFLQRTGVCARKSRIVNIPFNRVQDDVANRHGSLDAESLLARFEAGLGMDTAAVYGRVNDGAHQEIDVPFVPRDGFRTAATDATTHVEGGADPEGKNGSGHPLPRVSVVIPCYGQAKYLPEAVASVADQTYPNLEVVIVNDGSPDDTSAVARQLMDQYPDLSIHLAEQENKGLSAARNAGVAASSGKYWLPLDADDRIDPVFVEKCVQALEALPEAGFAYTDIQHFGDLDTIFRLPAFDAEAMVHKNNIGCVCSLVRRKVWEAVGGYDPLMKEGYEDWDFWIGCIEKGWGGVHIAAPLFFYRKRSGSMLADARKKHEALFARIVLNHPALYPVERIEAAARTIRQRTRAAVGAPDAALPAGEKKTLTVTYLIHSVLGVTGGNQTLVRQSNALAERGHRVHIVTYSEKPAWFDFKADLIRVPAGEPMADHVPSSDVVIATYFLNAPELSRVEAPVKIYFAQGDQYIFGDDTPIADPAGRAEREKMRQRCAESYVLPGIYFVANSFNLAATVHHRYGRMADAVLPPCSDQEIFRPLEKQTPPPWRILVVGPDARGSDAEPLTFKGIGDIRQAVDLLAEDGPDFRVVRMSNTTADIFKGMPCEFHFKPGSRKKTEIYGKAHILVYASHYDSRPYPPMEAMAAGAAVVCTATPGALEYCRHEENCLLVPVACPSAIAEAIARITADPALYRRLVAGGRATAARYPRESEWDALENLLRNFTRQASAGAMGQRNADRIPPGSNAPALPADDIHPQPATETGQKESPMNLNTVFPTDSSRADSALAHIRQSLVENERYDAAVSALNGLIDDYPDHAGAHSELGRLHHALGEADAARQYLERAADLAPGRADFRRYLADFYQVALDRKAEALAIYESLAEAHPADAEISLMAGHLNVGLQRLKRARDYYKRVLENHPGHEEATRFLGAIEARSNVLDEAAPEDDHARARELAEAGRMDEAMAMLETLVARQPDCAVFHNDLGVICFQKGQMDRALSHYRRAADLAPQEITFQKNLADFFYVHQGDVAEALKIFVRILDQHPDDVETLMTTGHICVSQHRFDDAAHFYTRVLEVEPWHGEARRFLDAVEKRCGEDAAASAVPDPSPQTGPSVSPVPSGDAAYLQNVLKENPNDPAAHSRLGELLHEAGDMEAARYHLESAASLAPDDFRIQKQMADFTYVALGKAQEALTLYNALAKTHPEDTEILMLAGHLAVGLGRLDEAEDKYRRVMRVEPWHADAGRYLEALERHRNQAPVSAASSPEELHQKAVEKADAGDLAGALTDLENLIAAHSDHALAHNDLGVLYSRQQKWEQAVSQYQRAVSLEPANPVFRKNLADCYAGTQHFQEALEIYVNLLAEDPYDVEALLATGQICMVLEQLDNARHFFDRALEAEPWNSQARDLMQALTERSTATEPIDIEKTYDKALQQADAGDIQGAMVALHQVIAADPDHAPAHNDLGVLSYRAGDNPAAETHYLRAMELDPANTVFQKNLADFYCLALGRVEDALGIYVNLLAQDPYDVEALLATGQICMALDQPENAAHFFQRVLEAEPWNAQARKLLDQVDNLSQRTTPIEAS